MSIACLENDYKKFQDHFGQLEASAKADGPLISTFLTANWYPSSHIMDAPILFSPSEDDLLSLCGSSLRLRHPDFGYE